MSALWAHDNDEERAAFDRLMALILERQARWPDMHVYHYGGYEAGALKRLMGRHAIRVDEVDALLRGRVLVDLYAVVRQGLRVSEESYSLKKVEHLYLDTREGPATHPGYALVQYEEWLDTRRDGILTELQAYNRDDCVSIWRLRQWLEERRSEVEAGLGAALPRPAATSGDPGEKAAQASAEVALRFGPLQAGGPDERLLASLLDWHRREEKPQWWRYFFLRERPMDELVAERDALGALEYVGELGEVKESVVHRYRYDPEQEHPFKAGDKPIDPADEKGAGEVVAVDRARGTIDLKRGRRSDRPHPRSLIEAGPYSSAPLRAALLRVADHVIGHGMDGPGPHRAVRDLIARRPPRVSGRLPGLQLAGWGDDVVAAARRIVLALDDSYLPIQGPPGSGKTYTGARMILSLVRAGRRVGITANAHKAVVNMIEALERAAEEEGVEVCVAQKAEGRDASGSPIAEAVKTSAAVADALASGRCQVAAGTAWLFAAEEMQGAVDVLFVDEAGQMSLASAVAAGSGAASLVLLGDPNQLPQVTQGTHPDGASRSALEHVLGGETVMPAERGLFLSETRRLHPGICRYVSDAFYAAQLRPHPSTARQAVSEGSRLGDGAGIVFVAVEHDHRAARSPEEADLAAEIVGELLNCRFTDARGRERRLRIDDVLLVSPYNAQVAELTRAVQDAHGLTPRAGTVDKFQGQEAAVVLYSMATSSPDDVPRNVEFLYQRNRLNVAVSRARCFAVVLASPRLLDVLCRTPGLMRSMDAFCRLLEACGAPVAPVGCP
jgi:uncharacterized protein